MNLEVYDCSYDEDTLNHLRDVELFMLKDFIEICEENDLHYHLQAGSLLGAIRHGGFIPWDDEIDIAMFREDYEEFLKIIEKNFSDKYFLLNLKTDFNVNDNVYTPRSLFCLKDTNVNILGMENLGIYLDICVMEFVPKNSIKRLIFVKRLKRFYYFLGLFKFFQEDKYSTKFREKIGHILKFLLEFFQITPNLALKRFTKLVSKQKLEKSSCLLDVSFYYEKPIPLEVFNEYIKVKFESLDVYIPKDYDKLLKIYYGNYMEFPPKDKRKDHNLNPIDFGKY